VSSVLPLPSLSRDPAARAWLIALAGYLVMMGPVYWWAANVIWQDDDHAHGAIVLAVVVWLFWTLRHRLAAVERRPAPVLGGVLFGFGLFIYFVGRMFDISILEMAAQIPVLAGGLLLLKGREAVRIAWFPLFYLIFMIPLPGVLVDAITGPLKQWISSIVVALLYRVGYPIAQSGVVISIGQYELLVADACSGLHSMFSLTALGTLFMYIMNRRSRLHNVIMLASILPIAFVANICRVIVLVLVTYHLGDAAGQGFLHGTAGFVLMGIALMIFFALDSLLARVLRPPAEPPAQAAEARP
jgi:exosortase B